MADPAHIAAHDPVPESDEIDCFPTPNRQLIAAAGRLARAEQERLEKELGLQDGRTPRPG
jgi:hypothetical protein